MAIRWNFFDPSTTESQDFDINPSEGGSPSYEKNVVYDNTTAPEGKTIIFEGSQKPQEIEITGKSLEEEQYNVFVYWFTKKHQITITDDLLREFSVYITSFIPKRERAVLHPWKHSYTIRYTIVDWPPVA